MAEMGGHLIQAGGKRPAAPVRRRLGRRRWPPTPADGRRRGHRRRGPRRRRRRARAGRLALPRRRDRRGRRPAAASRASTPAGATSRRSSPATSCWPRRRRSPPSLGTEVAGLLAATIGRLCEGEVHELRHAYDPDRTEAAYLAAIEGKTAALFATACRVGGHRRRPAPRPTSTASPTSAAATAWRSRSSTTCSTSSPPTSSSASPPATTSPRASTTCPCSAPSRSSAATSRALLGGPIDGADARRPRAGLVRASVGVDRSRSTRRPRATSTHAVDARSRPLRRAARRQPRWPAPPTHLRSARASPPHPLGAERHRVVGVRRRAMPGRSREDALGPGAAHRHRRVPVAGVGVDGDRAASSAATSSTGGRPWLAVAARRRRARGHRRSTGAPRRAPTRTACSRLPVHRRRAGGRLRAGRRRRLGVRRRPPAVARLGVAARRRPHRRGGAGPAAAARSPARSSASAACSATSLAGAARPSRSAT